MDVSTDYSEDFCRRERMQSFSLAVSRVHKSQGAISTQIAKLEEQAGIKLIDRSQRNFRLTEAGEMFLTFAKETLAKAQQVKGIIRGIELRDKGRSQDRSDRSVGIYVLPDIMWPSPKNFRESSFLCSPSQGCLSTSS